MNIGPAAAALLVCLLSGCAKVDNTSTNDAEKIYIDAWMEVNHPNVTATGNGIYILDDQPGSGKAWNGEPFILVDVTTRSLDGTVSSTTDLGLSRQIGSYQASYYYGPTFKIAAEKSLPEGVEEMLAGMKAGGTRTALIPSWLMTTSRYKSASKYFKKTTNASTTLYTLTLADFTSDITAWEGDTLDRYAHLHMGVDSTGFGRYYKQLKAPVNTNGFPSDTTVYINYTGRLLNGQVFDTTIKDTAKFYNIYSSSKSYEPVSITWGETSDDLKMDSNDLKAGFQWILWNMHKYEKGVGAFISQYGYSYTGSGKIIPPYAPLVFEIEMVDDPS